MVSFIQSNFKGMGSGMTPEGLGFMLQNRGELFSLEEGHFNGYAPRKRPFHTIIPGFVTRNGEAFLSFGVMGATSRPWASPGAPEPDRLRMNLQEAGDAPRINHEGSSSPTGDRMTDGGVSSWRGAIPQSRWRGWFDGVTGSPGTRVPFGGYQAIGFDAAQRVYRGASRVAKRRPGGRVLRKGLALLAGATERIIRRRSRSGSGPPAPSPKGNPNLPCFMDLSPF